MFITTINGKRTYKLSEIMRQAWVIFRTSKTSFSSALKAAWSRAKSVMRSILAAEQQGDEQTALFDAYKDKLSNASAEEEMQAILEEALDEGLEMKYYDKLESYACSML